MLQNGHHQDRFRKLLLPEVYERQNLLRLGRLCELRKGQEWVTQYMPRQPTPSRLPELLLRPLSAYGWYR